MNEEKHCNICTNTKECKRDCKLYGTCESVMFKTGWTVKQIGEELDVYYKALDQYAETDEFKEALEKYFDQFVNINLVTGI